MARAKEGNAEGLHFLYVRYAPDVARVVDSVVHDYHEAEDITQEVFAKLMRKIGKYEQREVPFTAWILRVARNAAFDRMRARGAVPSEEVGVTDPTSAEINLDRGRALRQSFEELPMDQREVLLLWHVGGLSPVQIASTLDTTERSVRGLHHRGCRTLQANLARRGGASVVDLPAA